MSDPKMEVMAPADLASLYPPLNRDELEEAVDVLAENMGGRTIETLDLLRIKVPTGGLLSLAVETETGEDMTQEVEGIALASRSARIYFGRPYAGGGPKKPPQCTSTDGFIGVGDPGGVCRKCPYAQYNSAIRPDGSPGGGQACKEIRQVLMLLPGEVVPHLLNVPPTSIKAFDRYYLSLSSARVRFWGATTRLTLERATADGGQPYSKLKFRLGQRLNPDNMTVLKPFHERMCEQLKPAVIDSTAYEVIQEAPEAFPPEARRPSQPGDEREFRSDDVPF